MLLPGPLFVYLLHIPLFWNSRHFCFGFRAATELVEPIGLMGEECAMMMLEKLNGGKSATAPPAASAMTATWCLRAQRSIPSTVVSPILHKQLDKTRVDLRSICTKVITHARYDGQALQEGPNLKKTGFSPSKMP